MKDFERTYVEKMRLAVEVLLDCADDLNDTLQVELYALKDKLDHGLLQDALNTRPSQHHPPQAETPVAALLPPGASVRS